MVRQVSSRVEFVLCKIVQVSCNIRLATSWTRANVARGRDQQSENIIEKAQIFIGKDF